MNLFGLPVVHGSESMFSEPLFHCIMITCFPLGTIEFQLKKASEGLSFLSSFLLLVIDFNNCYETEKKKVSFFSSSCHFALSLSANH